MFTAYRFPVQTWTVPTEELQGVLEKRTTTLKGLGFATCVYVVRALTGKTCAFICCFIYALYIYIYIFMCVSWACNILARPSVCTTEEGSTPVQCVYMSCRFIKFKSITIHPDGSPLKRLKVFPIIQCPPSPGKPLKRPWKCLMRWTWNLHGAESHL